MTMNYVETIQEKYPELNIQKVHYITEGQSNVIVVVNKTYAFRFPKYEFGLETLLAEAEILWRIHEHLTLPVPVPIYSSFEDWRVGHVFTGYKMIQGVELRRKLFLQIDDQRRLASQLGNFLRVLHQIPVEELPDSESLVRDKKYWEGQYKKIQEHLFPHMRSDAREEVSASFTEFLGNAENFNYTPVLIHGDFGPTNIIYDIEKEEIGGIIDFSSVGIGDPAIDIASLMGPFGYGEEFVEMCGEYYPGVEDLLPRARFYVDIFALQEALFGVEAGDKDAFRAGMKSFV